MMRSAGFRFLIVGFLVLLMSIPLFFAGSIIDSRSNYSRQTIDSLSREWGGRQILGGPVLVVPVEAEVSRTIRKPRLDPATGEQLRSEAGVVLVDLIEKKFKEARDPYVIAPTTLETDVNSTSEIRKRGIFRVPVYRADTSQAFGFDLSTLEKSLPDAHKFLWSRAEIQVSLGANRALRRNANLVIDGKEFALEPLAGTKRRDGIRSEIGDPRKMKDFSLSLGLNGAKSLKFMPTARNSQITLNSDWPHPSFDGRFLPDGSEITDQGFTATWKIPHLARTLPAIARSVDVFQVDHQLSFGVTFYQPNDFYQKAYRAGRYGILFIALTFLTVLLIEKRSQKPAHPVQYILIGLSQSMFVVLMVAFAEQIGFGPAYAVASVATIGLITMFGATALKLGRATWILAAILAVVYAVLFLILRSADYALLAGASLTFVGLAGTMYATRNEDWYGADRPKSPWFNRVKQVETPS